MIVVMVCSIFVDNSTYVRERLVDLRGSSHKEKF